MATAVETDSIDREAALQGLAELGAATHTILALAGDEDGEPLAKHFDEAWTALRDACFASELTQLDDDPISVELCARNARSPLMSFPPTSRNGQKHASGCVSTRPRSEAAGVSDG